MCVCACVSTGQALPLPGVATQPDPLSQPLFKRFTQTRWAAPQQILEEIISTVAERMPEFSDLQDCFREVRGCWAASGGTRRQACVWAHPDALFRSGIRPSLDLAFGEVVGSHGPARSPTQELLEAVHLHLVKEYVTRLCKRRLVLKTAEQQQQLAGLVQANAQHIQQFCTQSVSPCPPRTLPWQWAALLLQALHGLEQPLWASPNLMRSNPSLSGPRARFRAGPASLNKPVPTGLPGHLAAPRPPQAC